MKLLLFVTAAVILIAILTDVVFLLALIILHVHGNLMINCASYITSICLLLILLSGIIALLALVTMVVINHALVHLVNVPVRILITDNNPDPTLNSVDHGIVIILTAINAALLLTLMS